MSTDTSEQFRTPDGDDSGRIKVFLSYSRKDAAFVGQLSEALSQRDDILVFRDTEDILPTEEWKARLANLISQADTIVFCLSPNSATSDVCKWEVAHAERLNKRIIPVVVEQIDHEDAPEGLSKLNYIFFESAEGFDTSLDSLVQSLHTDIGWIREHTRIGELARRWSASKRPDDLLRGAALFEAEQWIRYRPGTAPELSEDIKTYLLESRKEVAAAERRKKRTLAAFGFLAAMIIVGATAWWQQDLLRENYHWHVTMRPSVLSVADENALTADPRPKTTFAECKNGCPTMVVLPAGKFMMGRVGSDALVARPQHEVTIPEPFAVSRTEITFAEWDACVTAGGCPKLSDNTWGRENRPAILMSWDEAKQYAVWLTKLTGKDYRLLSEAEWEYAARAGNPGEWSFGDDVAEIGDYAWSRRNSDHKTQPVGKKKPNAFGLYDMHGNVSEWTEDCWNVNYVDKPEELKQTGEAWTSGNCRHRVARGGSWILGPYFLRSGLRDMHTSLGRNSHVGLRLGRTLDRQMNKQP